MQGFWLVPDTQVTSYAAHHCPISLVSNSLPAADKQKIASEILKCAVPRDENGDLEFEIVTPKPAVPVTKDTQLWQLAKGPRVYLPFHLLELGWDFLKTDPTQWEESEDFRKMEDFVQRLRVVNDIGEQHVQLFTDYHGKVTRDEKQRQYLMSTVKIQRRERSDLRRGVLMAKANRH